MDLKLGLVFQKNLIYTCENYMGVPKLNIHLLGSIVLRKGDNTLPPKKIKLPNKRVGKTDSPFLPMPSPLGSSTWS